MSNNPLKKYYRQPKIYIDLPSKGKFYPQGSIDSSGEGLVVYGMTAMDEILFKTPDALFSGQATVDVIKSCVPEIKDPWQMPQIDLDAVLIAIRIATYGEELPISFTCSNCKEENNFAFNLTQSLDYYAQKTFDNIVFVDPLTIHLRPLTYAEQNENSKKRFELTRMLNQPTDSMSEKEKSDFINGIYKKLNEIQIETVKRCIDYIEVDDSVVNNEEDIQDFITHSEKHFFEKIKEKIQSLSEEWKLDNHKANCQECETENVVAITLDNSDFFATK